MEERDNVSASFTRTSPTDRAKRGGLSAFPLAAAPVALPEKLPFGLLALHLLSAVALATAYGSSFLLGDALRSAGRPESQAGTIIGVGVVATLAGCAFSGRLAERTGILPLISGAAVVMSGAMACFCSIGSGAVAPAYLGGVLLGLGWSVFYVLAPLYLICSVAPAGRLEVLTLLSGSQMLGIGLSAPLGHVITGAAGGPTAAFLVYAALSAAAAASYFIDWRTSPQRPYFTKASIALSWKATKDALCHVTVYPILMIGLSACVFAGLSVFQNLYARSRGLDPNAFFLTFTITTVALRFGSARLVSRLPLRALAVVLFALTMLSVALMFINNGSAPLYVGATVLFALGYGLTYATLNAMVVNSAEEDGVSVPAASQVFTLSYFLGAFGFPYPGGKFVSTWGIDSLLLVVGGFVALNVILALRSTHRTFDAEIGPRGAPP